MLPDKKTPFATKEQEVLLQAALMKGRDAIAAWEKWKGMVDLEGHPDNASYRLLPLLYTNLKQVEVEHPYMNRLRGIYRQSWYKNQRLVHDMSRVLSYLHKAGIRTMVLKGASLIILHYRNFGVRPMSDVDILVPVSQVLKTADLLKRAGWTPVTEITDEDLMYRHSRQFNDSSGKEFDLHWHLLFDSCWEGADNDFWDGSVSLTFGGVPTCTPNATDMLLHIIVHGAKWSAEPPIRWIADAISLITSSDQEIDWNRLITQAKKHRVVLQVKTALSYVRDTYKPPIPESVMVDLDHIHISPIHAMEYRYITGKHATTSNTFLDSLIGDFPKYVMEYRRIHRGAGYVSSAAGLLKYLQYRLRKKNLYDLFTYLALRGIRITKRKLISGLKPDNV